MVLLAVSLWCALAVASQPAPIQLIVESDIGSAYRAGTEHTLNFTFLLEDPAATVDRGVLFLNVVEIDAARNYPQAAHKIFEHADDEPRIFRVPFDGTVLREGLRTTVQVRLRSDAPKGDYALVFQAFRGEQTNPNRVRVADRVAMKAFNFTVLK